MRKTNTKNVEKANMPCEAIRNMNLNDNTGRRLVYLPIDLDRYIEKLSNSTDRKMNYFYKEALIQYIERIESNDDFEKFNIQEINSMIYRMIDKYLHENPDVIINLIKNRVVLKEDGLSQK